MKLCLDFNKKLVSRNLFVRSETFHTEKAFETVLWAAELTQFGMCDTEKTKEKAPAWAIVPVTASTGPKPLRVLETRSPLTLLTLRLQGRSCSLLLVFGDAGSGRIGKGSGDASTVSG